MSNMMIFIPRSPFLDSDKVMPSLGPLYLKSFLESKGHKIDINDEPNIESLPNLDEYDFIGISTTTPQYYSKNGGEDLAKKLKEEYPQKKIIIGGAHATYYHEDLLQGNLFDNIVREDGEHTLLNILEGKKLPKIVYDKINEKEMNSFPIPWRDKKYLSKYEYDISGVPSTTAITGKNCPMGCKYCEKRRSGISLFSKEHLDKEIKSIKDAGFKGIMFFDDIFILNEKRTKDLCDTIKPHDLSFRCFGHAKLLSKNKKILYTLADAGCKEIGFGAESGNQEILDTVGKGNKVEQIYQTTENILESGLNVSAFLMIGLPGESRESIEDTEKYISKFAENPNFKFDYTPFFPYKGTYIRQNIDKFDLNIHLNGSLGFYKGSMGTAEVCVSTSHLSKEEIFEERERIINKYQTRFKGKKTN